MDSSRSTKIADELYYASPALDSADEICPGSDSEQTPEEIQKKRLGYEWHAKRIINGHLPLLQSAALKGPLTGWINPWRYCPKKIEANGENQEDDWWQPGSEEMLFTRANVLRRAEAHGLGYLSPAEALAWCKEAAQNEVDKLNGSIGVISSIEREAQYDGEKYGSSVEDKTHVNLSTDEVSELFSGVEPRNSLANNPSFTPRPITASGQATRCEKRAADSHWLKGSYVSKRARWDGPAVSTPTPLPETSREGGHGKKPNGPERLVSGKGEATRNFKRSSDFPDLLRKSTDLLYVAAKSRDPEYGTVNEVVPEATPFPATRTFTSETPNIYAHANGRSSDRRRQRSLSQRVDLTLHDQQYTETISAQRDARNQSLLAAPLKTDAPSTPVEINYTTLENGGGNITIGCPTSRSPELPMLPPGQSIQDDFETANEYSFVTEVAPSSRDLEKFQFRKKRKRRSLESRGEEPDSRPKCEPNLEQASLPNFGQPSAIYDEALQVYPSYRTPEMLKKSQVRASSNEEALAPHASPSQENLELTSTPIDTPLEGHYMDGEEGGDDFDGYSSQLRDTALQSDDHHDSWETVDALEEEMEEGIPEHEYFQQTVNDNDLDQHDSWETVNDRDEYEDGSEVVFHEATEIHPRQPVADKNDDQLMVASSFSSSSPISAPTREVDQFCAAETSQPHGQHTFLVAQVLPQTLSGLRQSLDPNDISTQSFNTTPFISSNAAGRNIPSSSSASQAADTMDEIQNALTQACGSPSNSSHENGAHDSHSDTEYFSIDKVLAAMEASSSQKCSSARRQAPTSTSSPESAMPFNGACTSTATNETEPQSSDVTDRFSTEDVFHQINSNKDVGNQIMSPEVPAADSETSWQGIDVQSPWAQELIEPVHISPGVTTYLDAESSSGYSSGAGLEIDIEVDKPTDQPELEGSSEWQNADVPMTPLPVEIRSFREFLTPTTSPVHTSDDFTSTQQLVDATTRNPWNSNTKRRSGQTKKRVSFGDQISAADDESRVEGSNPLKHITSPPPPKTSGRLPEEEEFDDRTTRLNGFARHFVVARQFKRILPETRSSQLLSSPALSAQAEAFISADRDVPAEQGSREVSSESTTRHLKSRSEASNNAIRHHWRNESPIAKASLPIDHNRRADLSAAFTGFDMNAALDDMGDFLEDWSVDTELRDGKGGMIKAKECDGRIKDKRLFRFAGC